MPNGFNLKHLHQPDEFKNKLLLKDNMQNKFYSRALIIDTHNCNNESELDFLGLT